MKKLHEYFEEKCRKDGTTFVCCIDETPDELKNFVHLVHKHFDCGFPNDWIYKTITCAFEALDNDKLDDCSIEADIYDHELIKWLYEPFAIGVYNEVIEEGLSDGKNLLFSIQAAQEYSIRRIYEMCNEFMEARESE